jgi:hypothetical protein
MVWPRVRLIGQFPLKGMQMAPLRLAFFVEIIHEMVSFDRFQISRLNNTEVIKSYFAQPGARTKFSNASHIDATLKSALPQAWESANAIKQV